MRLFRQRSSRQRRVLMVAYHYPPCFGSSGIQRTLKFTRHLPANGWQPIVLSAHPRAYPEVSDGQLREIPDSVEVHRAFALDTARHLAVGGRYARRLALPDRWASWWLGAVPAGLALIRRHRPSVLWSTYPIATAHRIGLTLHRLTGLPWVADFRDSMTEDDYPRHPLDRQAYVKIEQRVVACASRLIFTAPSTRSMYLERYPSLSPDRCVLIPNGYDEEDFHGLAGPTLRSPGTESPLRLVHAGLIYPEERDPRPFFRALASLKGSGQVSSRSLRIELRAAGSEPEYRALLAELGIQDLVHLLPALPYRQALEDCASAEALLLLQGPSCNHQIPAKAYEYLRLGPPILALTTEEGDTAALLRDTGGATIVGLLDEPALRHAIPRFLAAVREGMHPLPSKTRVEAYARHHQAGELAASLDRLAGTALSPGTDSPILPGHSLHR